MSKVLLAYLSNPTSSSKVVDQLREHFSNGTTPIPATEHFLADTGGAGVPEAGTCLAGQSVKPSSLRETMGRQARERIGYLWLPGALGELGKTLPV